MCMLEKSKITSFPPLEGKVSCTKNCFPGKAKFYVPKITSFPWEG